MNRPGYHLSPFARQAVLAARSWPAPYPYALIGQAPAPEPEPPAPPPPPPTPAAIERAETSIVASIRDGLGRITPALILVGIATGAAFAIGSGLVSRYVWRD